VTTNDPSPTDRNPTIDALLALEAWDRTDFRELWRAYEWPTDAEVARWNRR
jgi:hypothetical protein